MATSTIKVYGTKTGYPFKLTEDKNFIIEDIASYLSSYSLKTFTDYQYQKDLGKNDIKIKVVDDQSSLDKKLINCWKYVEITNSDNSSDKFYYFIKSKNWISKEAVELELSLDVLNTFGYNTDYKLSEKTTVSREHKDRVDAATKHTVTRKALDDAMPSLLEEGKSYVLTKLSPVTYTLDCGGAEAYVINKDTLEEVRFLGYAGRIVVSYRPADLFLGTIKVYDESEHETPLFERHHASYSRDNELILIKPDYEVEPTFLSDMRELIEEDVEKCTRKIDEYSEGFNPVLYKTAEKQVNSLSDSQGQAFYLAYYTRPTEGSEDRRMEAYLLADNEININQSAGITIRKTAEELDPIVASFPVKGFLPDLDFLGWLDPKDTGGWSKPETTWPDSFYGYKITVHRSDGGADIVVSETDRLETFAIFKFSNVSVRVNGAYYLQVPYSSIDFESNITLKKCITRFAYFYNWLDSGANGAPYVINVGNVTGTINSISNLDRTDSNIVKIVKLPYSPASFTPTSFPIGWVNGSIGKGESEITTLQLAEYIGVQAMSNDLTTDVKVIEDAEVVIPENVESSYRDDVFESKLYNSEFYIPKFTFDSFSYPIALENLILDNDSLELKVGFKVSSLISSDYMFTFDNLVQKRRTQDYESLLTIKRNNELPLFSDDYLNYLRNGYNYEVKTKQRKDATTAITTGLGIASTVAGIVLSATGYGAALGAPMIVAGVTSTATSLTNGISSSIQSEQSIQQKLNETRNQAESVSSCDSVDLMSIYTQDKAKLCTYEASERVKAQLADLFYFCGYATNEQKLPDVTSRYWFNFLQCQPDLDTYGNLDDENVSKLTAKFNEGVTFMHKHNGTWDIDQVKENIEVSIL